MLGPVTVNVAPPRLGFGRCAPLRNRRLAPRLYPTRRASRPQPPSLSDSNPDGGARAALGRWLVVRGLVHPAIYSRSSSVNRLADFVESVVSRGGLEPPSRAVQARAMTAFVQAASLARRRRSRFKARGCRTGGPIQTRATKKLVWRRCASGTACTNAVISQLSYRDVERRDDDGTRTHAGRLNRPLLCH